MNFNALAPLINTTPVYPPEDDNPASNAIQQFAKDNGFNYHLRKPELVQYSWKDYKILPAWLGMVGVAATKDAHNVINGEFMEYPFTMFLMWDDITNGVQYRQPDEQQRIKYIQQQTTGIIRITLPKLFPQIVLDSNKNDRVQSSIRTEYVQSQLLKLEGDFAQYFDLYVPVGLQINALSLLAPNFMQILKNHSGLFDVEFNGNELILMTRVSLYSPQTMELLQEALAEQLTYMNRLLQSWNYIPNRQPIDLLEKPFIVGSTLKLGQVRMSAKIQLITISVLFLLFALFLIMTD